MNSDNARRIPMARSSTTGMRSKPKNTINNDFGNKTSQDLLSREEQYKKLNDELEAKTADLVREADAVMQNQDSLLSQSLLGNINADDFLENESDIDGYGAMDEHVLSSVEDLHGKPPPQKSTNFHPVSKANRNNRPFTKTKNWSTNSSRTQSRSGSSATPDDPFLKDIKHFSHQAITSLVDRVDHIPGGGEDGEDSEDKEDLLGDEKDVLPAVAEEMGAEAQIRFMKAKLRVMQEELDRLSQECHRKDEENASIALRLKELQDERGRLHRTNAAQQTQIDKLKKIGEDAKNKSVSVETQLATTRKELESLKRVQKQQQSTQSVSDVRLNRALEELERCKEQLNKAKAENKDLSSQDKRKFEQLKAENKRLEKQKTELIAGFKKQLKLIDVLKKQKIHMEAARLLSFTEEEFLKALDWGGANPK